MQVTKMLTMDSKKIVIKTKEQIELIRESALIVSKTLGVIANEIKPGSNSLKLDKIAEEFIRDNGGIPGFFRYVWLSEYFMCQSKSGSCTWYPKYKSI